MMGAKTCVFPKYVHRGGIPPTKDVGFSKINMEPPRFNNKITRKKTKIKSKLRSSLFIINKPGWRDIIV
jgi:hypothetical protein